MRTWTYRKIKRIQVAIEKFPKTDEENEKDLKNIFLEAKKIVEANKLSDRYDYGIARSIFLFELYRRYFYGWNPEEIINHDLIDKIYPPSEVEFPESSFLKKWLAHGRFESRMQMIIWEMKEVKVIRILRDEDTDLVESYLSSFSLSDDKNFKIQFPDKEKIMKLLGDCNDVEKKSLLDIVQRYKDEVIKKLESKRQRCLNEIEYIKSNTIPSIEERKKQVETLNFDFLTTPEDEC